MKPDPCPIADWPALEATVARIAAIASARKLEQAKVDAALADVRTYWRGTLSSISESQAIEAKLRDDVEAFCTANRNDVVCEGRKSRDLPGGHVVAFALNPHKVTMLKRKKLSQVCRAICERGRKLLGWLKKPTPSIDKDEILKLYQEAEDKAAFKATLSDVGLKIEQDERFELKLSGGSS